MTRGRRTPGQIALLKRAFLTSFGVTGNITESCEAAGVGSRNTVTAWKEHDDDFLMAYREAEIQATERLESEARRRAVDGDVQQVPIFHRGKLIHTVTERKKSDTLLIFLLKARDPDKYRENVNLHHSGRIRRGDPERPDLSALSLEELELYERLYAKATSADA